jgi:hypothetical protein
MSLLLLAVLGCSGGPSEPSTGGSLRVSILGLPAGATAGVTVTGPGGYSQALTSTTTLSQLTAGIYAISATDISTSSAQYSPSPVSQTVAVNNSQSTASIVYAATSGSLSVNISGLGTSKTAAVTVTGPAGYNHSVSSTTTLRGLTPGDYTVNAAGASSSGCTTDTPTPSTQTLTILAKQTATANVSYSPTAGSSTVNLCIAGMYLIQSAQNLSGGIPLVQNRDAYLRVFPVADIPNTAAPVVQLRILLGGVPQGLPVIVNPTRATVPTAPDESNLDNSWNYRVDQSLIQPGLSIEATVDPTNTVIESNESDNVSTLTPLDIRPVPTLSVTMLPIQQTSNGLLGNVTDANKSAFLAVTQSMHPINGVDIQVRSNPLTISTPLTSNGDGWIEALDQVRLAALADGRYYYGVAKVSYSSGVAGIAYVSQPSLASHAAMGWDAFPTAAVVMAHELAHNWGRKHAPCGGPSDVDVSYPDPAGLTDSYGLDLSTPQPTLKAANLSDIMGYCDTKWVSEYTYRGVFDYLAPSALPVSAGAFSQPAQPTLLVWGHLDNDVLVLNPAFQINAHPTVPSARGPYLIEGRAADGTRVFGRSFQMNEIADVPGTHRSFAFTLPLSDAQSARLTSIRLTGEGRMAEISAAPVISPTSAPVPARQPQLRRQTGARAALRWDPRQYPMIMVRDPDTGDVLSFARGGDVQVITGKSRVDLVLSNGVQSTRKRVQVTP